jgi:hypothetical protein
VSRRHRRAKTDRIDGEALIRTLMAFKRGEPRVCSMVRVPTPEEEDRRRICRERKALVAERVLHVNRIKGLLLSQGIQGYEPMHRDRRKRLEELQTGDGRILSSYIKAQICRELDRLELLLEQIKAVEVERDALVASAAADTLAPLALLAGIKGIGPEFAVILDSEGLFRHFDNRRQVAAYAGLAPSPWQIVELAVENPEIVISAHDDVETFGVRVFKFYAPRMNKSKIALVAHRREVTDVATQTYIPEFADEFYDSADDAGTQRDRNYVIKAYVFGAYLDRKMSLERGAFNFQRDTDMLYGISQSQIESRAAEVARGAMGPEITIRKERKAARIEEYISTHAPWHRAPGREADFSSLSMKPNSQEIELHLQSEKFARELKTRAPMQELLKSGNPDTLHQQVADVVASISQTSKNDLIHYVSMRKCVLDLFEKVLETDEEGKYQSEGDVHDIIMPRRKDSETLL